MLLSHLSGNLFKYQDGFEFVLMNGFAFIVVFSIFFVRPMYPPVFYYALLAALIFLFASGTIFLGGKGIVIVVVALAWGIISRNRRVMAFSALALVGGALMEPAVETIVQTVANEGALLPYKFSQLSDLFANDIDSLSAMTTSMGNLSAEALTIGAHMASNPVALLFGKGFGAGVPDIYGYLGPFVGPGAGYSEVSLTRNNFVRMHLPVFEVALKAGVGGLIFYAMLVVRNLHRRTFFGFVVAVLAVTVFSNTKETLLLTCLFMAVADETAVAVTGASTTETQLRQLAVVPRRTWSSQLDAGRLPWASRSGSPPPVRQR
jgi:hypothetical protein